MQKGYNLCNSARLTTRRGAVRPLRSAYETILTRYTYLHEILSLLGSRGLEPNGSGTFNSMLLVESIL